MVHHEPLMGRVGRAKAGDACEIFNGTTADTGGAVGPAGAGLAAGAFAIAGAPSNSLLISDPSDIVYIMPRCSPVCHFIDKSRADGGLFIWEQEDRLNANAGGQAHEHWIVQAYDKLGPKLYRHALMILADPALAEDAVQQAFTRLLSRGRVGEILSVEAFLRVVVRNEAYRLMAQRRPTEPIENADVWLLVPADESAGQVEEHRQLEAALRQLPPDQREVVHLKVYEQMTFAQIAQLLSIPQNTAASRYRYAIARLRELLPTPRI